MIDHTLAYTYGSILHPRISTLVLRVPDSREKKIKMELRVLSNLPTFLEENFNPSHKCRPSHVFGKKNKSMLHVVVLVSVKGQTGLDKPKSLWRPFAKAIVCLISYDFTVALFEHLKSSWAEVKSKAMGPSQPPHWTRFSPSLRRPVDQTNSGSFFVSWIYARPLTEDLGHNFLIPMRASVSVGNSPSAQLDTGSPGR